MKLSDIIKTLEINLPKYTDKFTSEFSVSSLTRSGSTVTVVTTTAHGLSTGHYVNITGALTPNPITSLSQSGGVGTLVTQYNHDITMNSPLRTGDSETLTISGADDSEYNGTFTISEVTASNEIKFVIDNTAPASTSNAQLNEDISRFYNGRYTVTVVDTTTFTYTITDIPDTTTTKGTIKVNTGYRISGDVSIDHILSAYTKQSSLDDWWCFVVLDSTNASKQRIGSTDAIGTYRAGQILYQKIIQNVSVYVIKKNTSDFTSIQTLDDIADFRPNLIKSLHLANFETGFTDNSINLVYTGDIRVDDGSNKYIHHFLFQGECYISNDDGVEANYTKKLATFDLHTLNTYDELLTQASGDLPNAEV